ncbi:hypothetical protein CONPUDRAFT_142462 [Coniophora puteana RWD-64-598 SS2]|uniref:Uncharacterized protein n=1 Tax=Coniophora puteana (strain RWD-64-598) TaxID=741705 RepID=A0A5M3MXS4_CONPW|nr:uncharacterized protein CONPUDRAFT_142462 [Coniophora puteana RWD-64-598 SS2]EIW83973.1 hypothetical protein CONPUDRAFT_142462 [Coniophora puteana RWD-64-598 SS2]
MPLLLPTADAHPFKDFLTNTLTFLSFSSRTPHNDDDDDEPTSDSSSSTDSASDPDTDLLDPTTACPSLSPSLALALLPTPSPSPTPLTPPAKLDAARRAVSPTPSSSSHSAPFTLTGPISAAARLYAMRRDHDAARAEASRAAKDAQRWEDRAHALERALREAREAVRLRDGEIDVLRRDRDRAVAERERERREREREREYWEREYREREGREREKEKERRASVSSAPGHNVHRRNSSAQSHMTSSSGTSLASLASTSSADSNGAPNYGALVRRPSNPHVRPRTPAGPSNANANANSYSNHRPPPRPSTSMSTRSTRSSQPQSQPQSQSRSQSQTRPARSNSSSIPRTPSSASLASTSTAAEEHAHLRALDTFLTKSDLWSGAQIIQAVQDLNAEIVQFAAGAVELVSSSSSGSGASAGGGGGGFLPPYARGLGIPQPRNTKAPMRPAAPIPKGQKTPTLAQTASDVASRVGATLTRMLGTRAHTGEDGPMVVQLALQAAVVTCLARALAPFCVGYQAGVNGVLAQVYARMRAAEPQATAARWRALAHVHIHAVHPELAEYATRELADTLVRWAADVFLIAGASLVPVPPPLPSSSTHPSSNSSSAQSTSNSQTPYPPPNPTQTHTLFRTRHLPALTRIARAATRLARVTREEVLSADFEVVAVEAGRAFVGREMGDAMGVQGDAACASSVGFSVYGSDDEEDEGEGEDGDSELSTPCASLSGRPNGHPNGNGTSRGGKVLCSTELGLRCSSVVRRRPLSMPDSTSANTAPSSADGPATSTSSSSSSSTAAAASIERRLLLKPRVVLESVVDVLDRY